MSFGAIQAWAVRFALDVVRDNGPQSFPHLRRWIANEACRRFPGSPGWSRRGAVRTALDEAVAAGLLVAELDCMPGDEKLQIKRVGIRAQSPPPVLEPLQ
jgi:hypothetical protein